MSTVSGPDATAALAPPAGRLRGFVAGWQAWWQGLSRGRKAAPALAVAAYWGFLLNFEVPRSDHIVLGIATLILGYAGRGAEALLRFFLPAILAGVIYDTQRYYPHLSLGAVHVLEPYQFDLRFFGIRTADGGVLTPSEWFQLHTHPLLDLFSGAFYLTYVVLFLGIAAWFQFRLTRTGTARLTPERVAIIAPRLMWGFLWLNLLGFATYHVYPAAPPWYVAEHGFGPVRMDTLPNPAGCARFDALLGTHFFTAMYSRSADVFGAVPSLHIAYPLLALWYAFRLRSLRALTLGFSVAMSFSAVYLNHHYVLDVLWGAVYALLVGMVVDWVGDRPRRASAGP